MPGAYTFKKLSDVEDSAPRFGFDDSMEARFVTSRLDAEQTGLSYHRIKAGKRQGFAHRHGRAEEVYVVLSGSGRVKLDDDIVELEALDSIRVAPGVVRCFEAGSDGLEFVVFGPRHDGDAELIPGWWQG
jgi:mannose-6-phosphate isomerase-like protein (cupin superfamily)